MRKYSVSIKENSWVAKIAAAKLRSNSVAIVLGNTVYLHNATPKEFLQDEQWLKHELCHVRQFKQYGFIIFLVKYLWFSFKYGYYDNPLEVEARAAENL